MNTAINGSNGEFIGASVIIFIGDKVLTKLRDDKPNIAFPNMWDFPGGFREQGETPAQTAVREAKEEFTLTIAPDDLVWGRAFPSVTWGADKTAWFFAAHLDADRVAQVQLGDEGQAWALMDVNEFLNHPQVVPHFKTRLKEYFDDRRKGGLPHPS